MHITAGHEGAVPRARAEKMAMTVEEGSMRSISAKGAGVPRSVPGFDQALDLGLENDDAVVWRPDQAMIVRPPRPSAVATVSASRRLAVWPAGCLLTPTWDM